jgi:cobalt-precorrin 5A hydrolase
VSRLLAVGLGSRTGVIADAVVDAVRDALSGHGGAAFRLCTLDRRAAEPGMIAAAARLGAELVGVSEDALRARSADVVTRSARSEAATGVPSVAESAALAGAGPGSRLVVPRRVVAGVTVAVAVGGEEA